MLKKIARWVLRAELADMDAYAKQRMEERDTYRKRMLEAKHALDAAAEWRVFTSFVEAQMTNREFLKAINWDFDAWPEYVVELDSEYKAERVMVGKAKFAAAILRDVFNGAKARVKAKRYDEAGLSFMRFTLDVEPMQLHVQFPAKFERVDENKK